MFSYAHLGASIEANAPSGYNLDHNRICLGKGPQTWDKAKRTISSWRMFDMPWLQLCWPNAPLEAETNVAVLVSHFGFWSLNACRIVGTIKDHGETKRFGFAYGTLADHSESGEESFSIEWHRDDDSVWYDIYAFSRPRAMLAKLGYPLSRILQSKFADCSLRAMSRAVDE